MFKLELSVADLNMIGAGLNRLTEPVDTLRNSIQKQIDAQLPTEEKTAAIPAPAELIETAKKKKAAVKAA